MTFLEVVYVGAGVTLPAYYLPQILRCASDDTQLASYSMSKSATQLVLRSAMLPFVYGIGNPTMTWVVSLDFAGRAVEFGAALVSLRRQQVAAFDVLRRCLPWPVFAPARERAPSSLTSDDFPRKGAGD